MLNGDDNEKSKNLIGFSSKTTTLHVQHNYFLLHFFAVVTRFMEEMSYVFTNKFLLNFLFSSLLLIFTLLGPVVRSMVSVNQRLIPQTTH